MRTAKRRVRRIPTAITSITITGYKSVFNESEVEIHPLTILAGANSSGKSSIMQPLLLLKQTLESPYDPGPLRLLGPNLKITSADQVLSRLPGKIKNNRFSIRIETGTEVSWNETIDLDFINRPREGFDILAMGYQDGKLDFCISPQMTPDDIVKKVPHSIIEEAEENGSSEAYPSQWSVARRYCFLSLKCHEDWGSGFKHQVFGFDPSPRFEMLIRRILHLPGLRGNPERLYPKTSTGPAFVGTFENYVASLINHWQITDDPALKELNRFLQFLDLTWKVQAKPLDDTQIELQVGRLRQGARGGARDFVNIADVGFGLSQSLPVLVALLTAEPGQMVYIEQPELHLHPRAQKAMAAVLAEAAKRGVRVVAETHSAMLLLGVQTLVAQKKLDPGLVKLHWFQRGEDGATTVTSADLDQNGAFGDWPEDFGEVELEAEGQYLDAAESRK
jgi:hypothetical protein